MSGERLATADLSNAPREELPARGARAGFNSWLHGELIQKALPELTKDERELLVSGTCAQCFDKMFEGGAV